METQLTSFTKKMIDHSNEKLFWFSFFCDCCESEYASPALLFSEGDWQTEQNSAFNESYKEAKLHFNKCSKCGNWVCDECFLADDMLCKKCK